MRGSFCECVCVMSHLNHRCRVCGKCEHLRCLGHPLMIILIETYLSAHTYFCHSGNLPGVCGRSVRRFRAFSDLICMSENEFDVWCSKFVRMTGRVSCVRGINASSLSNVSLCVCVGAVVWWLKIWAGKC